MTEIDGLYPFEIIVPGIPVSSQGSALGRARWMDRVGEIATRRQRDTYQLGFLDDRAVCVTICYLATSAMEGDIDNIAKPILDSLIAIAYKDDRQIERLVCQKVEPGVHWETPELTVTLLEAWEGERPLVYIRVDGDAAWRTL